jgi:hypothetical protein
MKTNKLEIEIVERADYRWMLCVPVSSVRIGETDRELVKKKALCRLSATRSNFYCKKSV